tara:strand:- start:2757 stop:2978 length:222 start_codon:yes stop_codon:yes gene_type:complete
MEFGETRLGVLARWIGILFTILAPTALLVGTLLSPQLIDIIYDFAMVLSGAVLEVLNGLLAMFVSILGLFCVT